MLGLLACLGAFYSVIPLWLRIILAAVGGTMIGLFIRKIMKGEDAQKKSEGGS